MEATEISPQISETRLEIMIVNLHSTLRPTALLPALILCKDYYVMEYDLTHSFPNICTRCDVIIPIKTTTISVSTD